MPSMHSLKGKNKIGNKQSLVQIEKLKNNNQSMMAIQTNYLQGGLFGNNSLDFIANKPSIPTNKSSPQLRNTIET